MKLIDKLKSTEFQFLLFVFEHYQKSQKKYIQITKDRDFKLSSLLQKDDDYNLIVTKYNNLTSLINSLKIDKLDIQTLNIVGNTIDEFDKLINEICYRHKILLDSELDDLPF